MKYVLMNKNTEILIAEYNDTLKGFDKIIEYKNMNYAPIILKNIFSRGKDILTHLNKWFKGRDIPNTRDNLEMLLSKLNIVLPEELLDKAFGLSLSDQYWIKPLEMDIKYKDINFFENDFDSFEFTEATFSDNGKSINEISLKTPNNTTDGMLRKSWIIENNVRYLLKGGYKNEVLQPFNEVLATFLSKRLGFKHVPYEIKIINNKVVSSCPCFIHTNTEYVPAYQIMSNFEKKYSNMDYENYIKILEDNRIESTRELVENMYIIDYLMLNDDRHLNNFGIIRDVNTLKWISVAPIFDTGQSLYISSYNNEEMIINGQGKFFYNIDSFDNIIKNIKNLKRIDISKLDGVVEEFDELLHKYKHITNMSEDRINKLDFLRN